MTDYGIMMTATILLSLRAIGNATIFVQELNSEQTNEHKATVHFITAILCAFVVYRLWGMF